MDQRRAVRVPIQIPVVIKGPKGDTPCLTQNINRCGLFVRSDTPRALRHLLQIRIRLSPAETELVVMAMVVHSVTPGQALETRTTPGMGLQLYGLDPRSQTLWETYVQRAWEQHQAAHGQPGAKPPKPARGVVDSVRRRHARETATFDVSVRDVDRLYDFLSRDISVGGVFLQSEPLLKVDSQVEVVVHHPVSGDEFPLLGRVARVVSAPLADRGMGIEFLNLGPELVRRFRVFIGSGLPEQELDDADLIVDRADPKLAR